MFLARQYHREPGYDPAEKHVLRLLFLARSCRLQELQVHQKVHVTTSVHTAPIFAAYHGGRSSESNVSYWIIDVLAEEHAAHHHATAHIAGPSFAALQVLGLQLFVS
jgi:hypothetical protein